MCGYRWYASPLGDILGLDDVVVLWCMVLFTHYYLDYCRLGFILTYEYHIRAGSTRDITNNTIQHSIQPDNKKLEIHADGTK